MNKKLILFSIDGLRPDGAKACGSGSLEKLMEMSTYTFCAKTVMPSITLPCHMSLFYGVEPTRHGILSNTFVPQVHTIKGIFEKTAALGKTNAIFYGWEPLRDVAPAGTCRYATYINAYTDESVDTLLTDKAIELIAEKKPDFVFLYQVDTDEKGGHDNGWMSEGYLQRAKTALDNALRVIEAFGDEYSYIITADHGGHDRMHGSSLPEDTTIPMFFIGDEFEKGKEIDGVSITDIAPTVAKIMGFEPEKEWEGRPI
ncbi:MAG: alkaline phosphatase family protein [Clostridia bacterium]|nr:alkaline phosphatase family protein [Clostridia bacterium]